MTSTTLGYAIIGGLLPAFIWLYFLLKEDATHPEPKQMIALAFAAGMIAVPLAVPLEQWVSSTLGNGLPMLTAWALIEEVLKYLMAAAFVFWRPIVYKAPDYVIYMITVALGFAAAENILFIAPASPAITSTLASAFITSNVRFIGPNLLHVFASGAIGFALAFSDRSALPIRVLAAGGGLILAVALHTTFNALIITQGTSVIFPAIFLIWTAAVVFFATFEVLKFFQSNDRSTNPYPRKI